MSELSLKDSAVDIKKDYWYMRTDDEVLYELKSTKSGLKETDVQKRLIEYGHNSIAQEDKNKIFKILFRNFNSLLIYILIASCSISLLLNHYVEFYVLLAIILVTGLSGFIQEYNAGKALEALSKLTVKYVYVLRDGVKKRIKSEDLVIGDVVFFERGMVVPADIRITKANSLSVNESILTGESIQKYKNSDVIKKQNVFLSEQENMLFAGTSITNGHGEGIVIATGLYSEIGKISQTLKVIGDKLSPLQKQISVMGKKISYTVLILCLFLFILLISRDFSILESLLLISAVAVSGIPESFPLAMTMTLSNGVKRMAKKNAIVKDLNSVETLGTCNVICTDKTGTLTENKMVVEKIFFSNGVEINVEGKKYEPNGKFFLGDKDFNKRELKKYSDFFKTCILCNNSDILLEDNEFILSGEPTEGALMALAKSAGFEDETLREENKRIFEIPFDPFNKFMITINKEDKSNKVYLKGAFEKVISKCKYIRTKTGKLKKLTKNDVASFHNQVNKYAGDSFRVLALASKKINSKVDSKISKDKLNKITSSGFIFEGMVAILDPIREEVYKAIEECKTANVKVVMITGDHKDTATSVGKKLGLIQSKRDIVLEGTELDNINDDELDEMIMDVVIFSRTTPNHKFRIVNSFQRMGQVVAMTGDGVNDAPALKSADIGVSMGKNGTDVAREASNMVLTDDNFATIVNAIKEGRTIYSNIRRFVYYLLPGNLTEVSLIIFTVMLGMLTPLTALMIIFINIVTSTFPALALSIEPTNPKVMFQKPRNSKQGILSKYVLLKIFTISPVIFFSTLLLFLWELKIVGAPIEKARTIAFAALILLELLHTFNSRSLHISIFNKNFFANKYIFMAIGSSLFFTVFAIQTKIGQTLFKTVGLTLNEWFLIALVSSSVIIFSEVTKALVNSEIKEQGALNMAVKKLNIEDDKSI